MNLLERMKPHYKEELEKWNLKIPDLVARICEHLENERFVHKLRYETIIDLNFVFGSLDAFKFFEEI